MKLSRLLLLVISLAALVGSAWLIALRREPPSRKPAGDDLGDARRRIDDLDAKLTAMAARLTALEKQREASPASIGKMAAPVVKNAAPPVETEGTFSVENGAVVYGPEAKLRVGNNVTVSSPAGVMVSDQNQKMIVGDLRLENDASIMESKGAVLDVAKHALTAESMTVTPKVKEPNPEPPNGTAPSVTLPAAQEPRH